MTVFFNEALPNFLKYVLKRKYASNQEHILEAQIFIDKTIKFLTGVINLGFDVSATDFVERMATILLTAT